MEEHKQSSTVEKFEKFTWKIENFSRLNTTEDVCSEPFVLGGYPWRITFYEWGGNADNLSIYLSAVKTANMSIGWRRLVKFRLFLFNQIHSNRTITHESEREFNARFSIWGFDAFVSSIELLDRHSGFLVKGACIFGAEVSFLESNYEKQVTQKNSKTVHKEVGVIRSKLGEGPGQNLGELLHFKGLGQIEKAFVPLLEEVCSQHPSLIVCQQKRSRKFSEWVFTALGRVLYFLKTKKVKDMDDLACKNLQIFWEELQPFGFDLTWLDPHVQSALGMKNYLKKVNEVKKLKEKVVALELEMERLKAKMVTVEVNLFAARDYLKAKDFLERDLDAELGY